MLGEITNVKIILLFIAPLVCWSRGFYRKYHLVQDHICNRPLSQLDSLVPEEDSFVLEPETSIILEQTWTSSTFQQHSVCNFDLEAPPNMGLYLIIRKLKLRRDSRGNCIDFMEVKQSNGKTTQFCFTSYDVPRSFTDNYGQLHVSITLNSHRSLSKISDTLDLQIIATVKGKCNVEQRVKPCDFNDNESCISERFFSDGLVNCPSCADENGYPLNSSTLEMIDLRSVILIFVVSLFFTMSAFGCCIWYLCRQRSRFRVLRNNPDRLTILHTAPNVNMELQTSSNDVHPSAPPIEQKELPPSYDLLFPAVERTTATTTS